MTLWNAHSEVLVPLGLYRGISAQYKLKIPGQSMTPCKVGMCTSDMEINDVVWQDYDRDHR